MPGHEEAVYCGHPDESISPRGVCQLCGWSDKWMVDFASRRNKSRREKLQRVDHRATVQSMTDKRKARIKKNLDELRDAGVQITGQNGKRFKTLILYYGTDCVYCGGPAETVEHLIPKARGGGNNIENLRPACGTCNHAKGMLTPVEWLGPHCPPDLVHVVARFDAAVLTMDQTIHVLAAQKKARRALVDGFRVANGAIVTKADLETWCQS